MTTLIENGNLNDINEKFTTLDLSDLLIEPTFAKYLELSFQVCCSSL
jgi:hypothetical protein